jgi:hypothetical protein
MKKVLAITNSFGVDANRYLYGIARSAGESIKIVTLYIGGCSLYRHYRCMLSEDKAYELHVDGINTGFKVSLKEALLSDEWNIVTYQQVSSLSGDYESYQPFLSLLDAYVKKFAPKAKRYIHAIWAWCDANVAKGNVPYALSTEMFAAHDAVYHKVAAEISAEGYIPSCAAMEKLYDRVGDAAYRDGKHANFGYARYMLGLVWFMTLYGRRDIEGVCYGDFDVSVTDEEKRIAEECAVAAVIENTYENK